MIRKLLLRLFKISFFLKIHSEKFNFKITFVAIFLGFSFNSIYAQCNTASTGVISSNNDKICVGSTELTWTTGWQGGVWSSSNPSVLQVTPAPDGRANAKGIAPGVADVLYTITQPNCSEVKSSKMTVTVLGTTLGSVGDISGITSLCNGKTTQYSIPAVTGGSIYTWKVPNGNGWTIVSGQGTNSISVTAGSGNGDIEVKVSNSCASGSVTKTLPVTVHNNQTPTPTISGSISLCAGGNVVLTSSSPDSNLWSTGETTKSITVTTAGSYTVKATKSGSCQSDSSSPANVTLATAPTFTSFGPATICANTSITYTTQASKSNYVWSLPGAAGNDYIITGGGIGASDNTVTLQWKTGGSKTVTVNYTTGCAGYSAASSTTVVSATAAGPASSSPQTCINTPITSVTHSLTNVNSLSSYTDLPSGVIPTLSADKATLTISGTPTQSGTFGYTVTLSTGCGNITATGTIKVNPVLTAGVSIASSATGPICAGTLVTFTATPTNGGTPSYQWKLNGTTTGTNSPTFATTTLANNDVVTCLMTSNASPCLAGSTVPSNAITTIVNPILTASVTIISDQPAKFCQGTGVRFNTTTINGGSAPQYQWYKGNTPIANQTGNTILFFDLVDGDKVKVVMTSSDAGPCLTGIPATSNEIQVSVYMTDRGYTQGGEHVCLGSPSPLLKLVNASNPNNGAPYSYPEKVTRWEYSDDNNATWVPIANTSGIIEYQPPVLSASRNYRAVAQGKKDNNDPCPITDAAVETRIYVEPAPTVTFTSQTVANSCIGTDITYTTQTNKNNYVWTMTGVLNVDYQIVTVTPLNTSSTVTIKWLTAGNKTVTVNYGNGNAYNCSAITPASATTYVNPTPVAPSIVSMILPTCTVPTGSVNLSGLPNSGVLRYLTANSSTATFTITGTTMTISGLAPGKYKFAIDNPCGTLYSSEVNLSGNTWNGLTWSGGNAGPSSNDVLVFEGDYISNNDLNGCSCTITNNAKVTIKSGKTMTITNYIHVDSGSLTFLNNASLLQTSTDNNINTGSINYIRESLPIRQADYVYWSSPVAGQTLGAVSPLTESDKYLSYSGTGWVAMPKSTVMKAGKGYIIRGPEGSSNTTRNGFSATFIGTPNNGNITSESYTSGKYFLLGNPYPSALDADEFIDKNPILEGTLYFWTHNSPVVLGGAYKYNADDYASYNLLGGTKTIKAASTGSKDPDNNKDQPLGMIAAGQGFMAGFSYDGVITYKNSMRFGGGDNGQFFKPGKTSKTAVKEKHRIWLNMTNTGGAFKQMLLGYVDGASNDYDRGYDGVSFDGNKYLDFYSMSKTTKYVIQGRGLPFTDTDTVPLGYKSTIAGDFTIAIDHADGLFSTQRIYLEDKKTGNIQDLTASNYTFATEIGTFTDRFVLRYTNKTLGTGDFENIENGLLVSVKDKTIKVTSAKESIKEVTIYDISGKQLYSKNKIGESELQISNLQSSNQVLLVKVILENDYAVTKKTVFQ